jgi:hypothetical protein
VSRLLAGKEPSSSPALAGRKFEANEPVRRLSKHKLIGQGTNMVLANGHLLDGGSCESVGLVQTRLGVAKLTPAASLEVCTVVGYDLHITRKQNWFDASPVIDLSEWLEYVAGDPELQHDAFAEAVSADSSVLRVASPGICVWKIDSAAVWFMWSTGDIVVKDASLEVRQKMWRIARSLQAKVQGDEGEYYGEDGQVVEMTTDGTPSSVDPQASDSRQPWWKFWQRPGS